MAFLLSFVLSLPFFPVPSTPQCIQVKVALTPWGSVAVAAVQSGFCGALTTVSTLATEARCAALRNAVLHRDVLRCADHGLLPGLRRALHRAALPFLISTLYAPATSAVLAVAARPMTLPLRPAGPQDARALPRCPPLLHLPGGDLWQQHHHGPRPLRMDAVGVRLEGIA